MKNLIFTLVLAMLSSVAVAQTDLSKLKRKDRDEYLERVSKEVVKELAPHNHTRIISKNIARRCFNNSNR